MKRLKNTGRMLSKLLAGLALLFLVLVVFFLWRIHIPVPQVNPDLNSGSYIRKQNARGSYQVNNCWLRKNKYGIWEMYIEGEAYERGLIYGVLAKELIEKQEACFVDRINELVPGRIYRNVLKYFVAWFNKDICKFIPEENQKEMYGISSSFSDKFDFIGPKYYRILNYHAAHDIGHALTDFSMVGCTSFAVTKESSKDSTLLIARNFDFYMGDDFAREKLLLFVNPDSGYKYASYSWAGLTGVVSGMNEKGLTVTINAAKSDIPFASKEPISILVREILQYAQNSTEAIQIAKKRETFVSESLLIGSAEDNEAVIIEKSPQNMDVYRSHESHLTCANHYQSSLFMRDSVNINNILHTDSKYRFDRVNELLAESGPLTPEKAVEILRNKAGLRNVNIGLGNQNSLNQLIAHHSIIFKPTEMKMWVSTSPYQLGEFVCYDLNKVFKKDKDYLIDSLNIKPDPFSGSEEFEKYEAGKITKQKIKKFVLFNIPFELDSLNEILLINSNPVCYTTYMEIGDYYKKKGDYKKAKNNYTHSLKLEGISTNERYTLQKNILACEIALNGRKAR